MYHILFQQHVTVFFFSLFYMYIKKKNFFVPENTEIHELIHASLK